MILLTIPGELSDLNTYVDAERTNRYISARIKSSETQRVTWQAKKARLKTPPPYPVHISCTWYTINLRKDADNVAFAKKIILDGLVAADVLNGDGRRHVGGFSDYFFLDKKNPRVEILITPLQ